MEVSKVTSKVRRRRRRGRAQRQERNLPGQSFLPNRFESNFSGTRLLRKGGYDDDSEQNTPHTPVLRVPYRFLALLYPSASLLPFHFLFLAVRLPIEESSKSRLEAHTSHTYDFRAIVASTKSGTRGAPTNHSRTRSFVTTVPLPLRR